MFVKVTVENGSINVDGHMENQKEGVNEGNYKGLDREVNFISIVVDIYNDLYDESKITEEYIFLPIP